MSERRFERTEIDSEPPASEPPARERVELAPGLRVAHYELIRELGRGGMGQVFLARDTRLGRRVAMKFVTGNSTKFAERFLVEARATARAGHENIVAIHEIDEYLGTPYMVLEYIEGTTLGQLIADKRLPAGRAVELIVPVVKALVRAHAEDIVHRDLKPDNILVSSAGTVKVVDFGIAKLYTPHVPVARQGGIVGTLPYMSPEQLGTDEVDHRSDLWAVGIILYMMLAGRHPLDPVSEGKLLGSAAQLDTPMPSLADDAPGVPDRLVAIVAKCLAKRAAGRYATAAELCADLEPLLPGRSGRNLGAGENPYPGLNAFEESDGNRFFGRTQDIAELVTRIHDRPIVGVVGPSGVGKSSLIRAGVVPQLKSAGEPWEVIIVRPGRNPLGALANAVEMLRETRDSDPAISTEELSAKLRTEPGALGARLRARARRRRSQILLFVDQHEELYTLVPDLAERLAFTACLAGAGDDPSGPLRVVVSMRSDFLDRAAEDRRFVDELTRGLVFLQPPGRAGLEEALVRPAEMMGFGFEAGIVDDMLATLESTPGSLPLLQFAASVLWETRDPQRRVLTHESYFEMGGVAGALATHADEVLAGLAPQDRQLARTIFQRLVTPERTRALVDASELRALSPDSERVVGHLVSARLVVIHTRGASEPRVELVHESLIKSWPALQRWLDENHEDAAYVAELRAAAKQWEQKGRPQGLLWRGEAMEEARAWRARSKVELAPRERTYLDAVMALATRARRVRRGIVAGGFGVLGAIVIVGAIALVKISNAEHLAADKASAAEAAERDAKHQAGIAKEKEESALRSQEVAEQALADVQHERAKADAATTAKLAAQRTTQEQAKKIEQQQRTQLVTEQQRQQQALLADEAKRREAAAKKKLDDAAKARGKITTDLK